MPTRRDLARKLLKVQRQIEFQAGFDSRIDAAWAKELLAVIAELDPRVTAKYLPQATDANVSLNNEIPNVCPEVYKGRDYDATLEHNFEEVKCESKKFKDVLTITVIAKGWESVRLEHVLLNLRKYYATDIVVLAFGNLPKSPRTDGILVEDFGSKATEATALNKVVNVITTPYILVVNSLSHFNDQSPLERLVRVLENLEDVAVASGAYRDIKGYWRHGCLQTTAENYGLKYTRGYEHSLQECMYCDDVLGPFVVKTDFLKRVPLTENMADGPALFRDWFLNVRLTGKLVVSCPDVMFFVNSEPTMNRNDWHTIAKKWSFESIHSFDGKNFEFSCEEAQISCTNLIKTVSSFLVPPCCRKKIREELGYIQDCAQELGIYYELQAGTLLGAVKMDGILPWDFDTDVITDCVDQDVWLTKGHQCMAKKGCKSKLRFGHYWTSACTVSIIDISCRYNRSITLPVEYRKVATQAELDGRWITVTSNPGRNSRNRYGPEYLKHAVHWRYYKPKSLTSPVDEVPDLTGLWSSCAEPAFHSCLDHFPVDGNIRFKTSVGKTP